MNYRSSLLPPLIILASLSATEVVANQSLAMEEVVVTANRAQEPWLATTRTATVVNAETVARTQAVHINELLARVAGTWISRGNGQEHLTAIRSPVLTGAGGCGAFLMTQDNVPLRASGFCNVNELFESVSELAEAVEVLKGPGGATHGSNALHGLIQVRTPSPGAQRNTTQIEAGPHNYARLKHLSVQERLIVGVSATSDDGYKTDSGYGQQKLILKHQQAVGAFEVINSLAVTNLNQETSGFVQGEDVYRDPAYKKLNPNPEAFRDVRSARLISDWQSESGKFRITPFLRWTDMRFLQHFLPGQPLEENGHRSLGLQSSAALTNNVTVGFDAEQTRGFLKQTQTGETRGSPFLVGTIPSGKHYDYDVTATVAAAFAQYDWPVSEDLLVTLGLRAERVDYDYDNRMISGRTKDDGSTCGFGGCRYNRPESRSDAFNNLSPKLGFNYAFGQHRLFGQLSKGFRAPQATELYRLQNGQNVADIDSEALDSLEVGLRGATARLSYQLTGFSMKKEGFIFQDTTRANVDNGETRHQGVEIEGRFALRDNLEVSANWTLARHRYDNNPALSRGVIQGNDIDTAPRSMGGLQVNWAPTERVTSELEWVHIGPYFTNPDNTNRYDGHDLINLRANLALTNVWQGFLRVTNLLDTDYAERADYAFGNERFFVGEPRGVYIGFRRSN